MTVPNPPASHAASAYERANLSKREMQILHLISHGKNNREIGSDLYITEDTVKTHVRKLFKKLNVDARTQAVRRGFELGLFDSNAPIGFVRPRPETPLAASLRQTDHAKQLFAALISLGWRPPGHL